MLKIKKYLVSLITLWLLIFISKPAFARSISLKEAGIALWIFVIIGGMIVLLQLIPAIILFFTFVGTTIGIISKRKRVTEELPSEEKEKIGIPVFEPPL